MEFVFCCCFFPPSPPPFLPLYLSNTVEVSELKVSPVGTGPIAVMRSLEGERRVICTLQKGWSRRRQNVSRRCRGQKVIAENTPRRSKQHYAHVREGSSRSNLGPGPPLFCRVSRAHPPWKEPDRRDRVRCREPPFSFRLAPQVGPR